MNTSKMITVQIGNVSDTYGAVVAQAMLPTDTEHAIVELRGTEYVIPMHTKRQVIASDPVEMDTVKYSTMAVPLGFAHSQFGVDINTLPTLEVIETNVKTKKEVTALLYPPVQCHVQLGNTGDTHGAMIAAGMMSVLSTHAIVKLDGLDHVIQMNTRRTRAVEERATDETIKSSTVALPVPMAESHWGVTVSALPRLTIAYTGIRDAGALNMLLYTATDMAV